MRLVSRFVALLFLGSLISVSAAAGFGVQNLTAKMDRGQIQLRWEAPAGVKVSEYRIYYSHQSILENGGIYDDFDKVDGKQTDFVIADFPEVPALYISVLPVDLEGKETDVFVDEVLVNVKEQRVASSAPAVPQPAPVQAPDAPPAGRPPSAPVANTAPPSRPRPTPPAKDLPGSGPEVIGIVALSGAVVGWLRKKRLI